MMGLEDLHTIVGSLRGFLRHPLPVEHDAVVEGGRARNSFKDPREYCGNTASRRPLNHGSARCQRQVLANEPSMTFAYTSFILAES